MKLTLSEAARACQVARTTIQRAVKTGRLSLDAEHCVDTAELLRVGYALDAAVLHAAAQHPIEKTPQNAAEARSTPQHSTAVLHELELVRQERDMLQQERNRLAQQVDVLLALHQTTQQHLTYAQQMLHEAQQRTDRLLEAPRAPVVPRDDPRPTPRPLPGRTEPPPGVVDVTTRMPAYHPDRHYLGTLCTRGHDWQGTGQSLRKRSSKGCLACDAAGQRARRQQRHL